MTANLLSKFPGFISHTLTLKLTSLCDLTQHETTSNYTKWKPQQEYTSHWIGLYIVSFRFVFRADVFEHAAEWETDHLLMHLVGPCLFCHVWLPFSFPPQERTESGGSRAATSTVPLSPPRLIFVVRPFETSISWGTKEWWSMCNKCRCHGNPRFPPQIFPFMPFEDLSPGRAGITRPRAWPWQSLFSACFLID